MSNRVEDLESQVAELQATIDGLTEELVETKERVRQLEDTTEQHEEAMATANGQGQAQSQQSKGSTTPSTADQQAAARGTDERRDAQFVENRDPVAEEPEEPADVEADTEDADDDDDDDGIIVA